MNESKSLGRTQQTEKKKSQLHLPDLPRKGKPEEEKRNRAKTSQASHQPGGAKAQSLRQQRREKRPRKKERDHKNTREKQKENLPTPDRPGPLREQTLLHRHLREKNQNQTGRNLEKKETSIKTQGGEAGLGGISSQSTEKQGVIGTARENIWVNSSEIILDGMR